MAQSFWLDVDGAPVHVRGDPNMDPKTREALMAMVRAFRNADLAALEKEADDTCPACGSDAIEWVQSDTQRGYNRCLTCRHAFPATA